MDVLQHVRAYRVQSFSSVDGCFRSASLEGSRGI